MTAPPNGGAKKTSRFAKPAWLAEVQAAKPDSSDKDEDHVGLFSRSADSRADFEAERAEEERRNGEHKADVDAEEEILERPVSC
jgi:hypothetical protein